MSEQPTPFQTFPGLRPQSGYVAVPCSYCNAGPGKRCVQGYDGWPNLARKPHAARRDAARLVAWWHDFGQHQADREDA